MFFILAYKRPAAQLLEPLSSTVSLNDARKRKAELESRYGQSLDVEVVLLESESEATLRRTHSRYFRTLEEMAANPLPAFGK